MINFFEFYAGIMCHNEPESSLWHQSLFCSRCLGIYNSFFFLTLLYKFNIVKHNHLIWFLPLFIIGGLHPVWLEKYIDGIYIKFIFGIFLGLGVMALLDRFSEKNQSIKKEQTIFKFQFLAMLFMAIIGYAFSPNIHIVNIIIMTFVWFFYYKACYKLIELLELSWCKKEEYKNTASAVFFFIIHFMIFVLK